MHVRLWVMHKNPPHERDIWILNTFSYVIGSKGFWCTSNELTQKSIWQTCSPRVYQDLCFIDMRIICWDISPKILPGLLIPCRDIHRCQYGYCNLCPYIVYNSDHCGSGQSVCTIVWRLCWKPLGGSPMAWLVQSIITFRIVGGCYRRYVDKIGSNTILLLSSIPCHWIGTMGRCQSYLGHQKPCFHRIGNAHQHPLSEEEPLVYYAFLGWENICFGRENVVG